MSSTAQRVGCNRRGESPQLLTSQYVQYVSQYSVSQYSAPVLPLAASLQGDEGSAQVTVWFSLSISGWVSVADSVLTILSSCSLLLSLSDLQSKTISISWPAERHHPPPPPAALQLLDSHKLSSGSTQLNLHLAGHKALLLLCPVSLLWWWWWWCRVQDV